MLDALAPARHSPVVADIRDKQIQNLMRVNEELRERIRQLEGLFKDPVMHNLPIYFGYVEDKILGLLLRKERVSYEDLHTVLYANKPQSDWPIGENGSIRTSIWRLRQKLKQFDIYITNAQKLGWRISSQDKKRLASGSLEVTDKRRNISSTERYVKKRGRKADYPNMIVRR